MGGATPTNDALVDTVAAISDAAFIRTTIDGERDMEKVGGRLVVFEDDVATCPLRVLGCCKLLVCVVKWLENDFLPPHAWLDELRETTNGWGGDRVCIWLLFHYLLHPHHIWITCMSPPAHFLFSCRRRMLGRS